MSYWLLKTEPGTYSYDDLTKSGKATWDGVSNPLALKNIRLMTKGDFAFIYHTGNEKSVVGIAEVVSPAYPDPKSKDPRLVVVDLKSKERLKKPVSLASMKESGSFEGFVLLRLPRLSVMPVDPSQWKTILSMSR